MAAQTKTVTGRAQVGPMRATVRRMATDTAQFAPAQRVATPTDRMETMGQIAMAGIAEGIGTGMQQIIDLTVVSLMASCTLYAQTDAMPATTETGRLRCMTGAAQLDGRPIEQGRMGTAMDDMA
jgi:hypothetical protein